MDYQSVTIEFLRVIYEAVWTLEPVRMLVAAVLDICAHHVATVISHNV